MQKGIGKSKLKLENAPKIAKQLKRLNGLYRINSDLLLIKAMVESSLSKESTNHNHFHDYQGIVILYRKCFYNDDKRGTSLTEKHLTNLLPEQQELHLHLLHIANKLVAHSEDDEYERVTVSIIIDNNTNKPLDIVADQTFFEPLSCDAFELLHEIIDLLLKEMFTEVEKIKTVILNIYEKEQAKQQIISTENSISSKETR